MIEEVTRTTIRILENFLKYSYSILFHSTDVNFMNSRGIVFIVFIDGENYKGYFPASNTDDTV